ncbi:hypothetical protein RPALISO_235 [Ruegeria phage RpAliso]|nr:hypothetical protein RPALISO_235 [Ruegeria phage RpAliso]
MARYTKTDEQGAFIGWTTLYTESDEATYPEDLGIKLKKADRIEFAVLEPGQRKLVGDTEFFREW